MSVTSDRVTSGFDGLLAGMQGGLALCHANQPMAAIFQAKAGEKGASRTSSYLDGKIRSICLIGGVLGVWGIYELLPDRLQHWLHNVAPYRFFVYLGFEPLLTIVQDKYYAAFPASQATNLLGYICLPALVVVVCFGVAYVLRRWARGPYFVLTGGR